MEQSKLINLIAFYLESTESKQMYVAIKRSQPHNSYSCCVTLKYTRINNVDIFFCTQNTITQKCCQEKLRHAQAQAHALALLTYQCICCERMENLFVISFKPTQKVNFHPLTHFLGFFEFIKLIRKKIVKLLKSW